MLFLCSLNAKESLLKSANISQELTLSTSKKLEQIAKKNKDAQKELLITSSGKITEKQKIEIKNDITTTTKISATIDLEKKNSAPETRLIAIKNDITEKMITYEKHWAKPFPSDFKARINDQEYLSLKNGKLQIHEKKFSTVKNKIKITYEWALKKFGKLWHHEQKEIEFEVSEKQQELDLKFSWEDDHRISINNAKIIMCSTIEPNSTT